MPINFTIPSSQALKMLQHSGVYSLLIPGLLEAQMLASISGGKYYVLKKSRILFSSPSIGFP
jgi:hypothetical protein